MAKNQPRIHDLVGLLNTHFPPELAAEWDNVGLQVGEPDKVLSKGLIALDPSVEAVTAAREAGAQVLITHHPLFFRGTKRLTPDDEIGRVVWPAVQHGIAICSVHTNLDCAEPGLNTWLADRLELRDTVPLSRSDGHFVKLVVYVPREHADPVAEALFAAGAGHVGAYDQCSFRLPGVGTFRPGEGSSPFIGKQGEREEVEEFRLEVLVRQGRLGRVLERLFRAHPYEEVAYDLVPLNNQDPQAGLGRIGPLAEPCSLERFAERVKSRLGCETVRVVGPPGREVAKAAVCGGSGASLIAAAKRQGADVIVTGDIKYHDAQSAQALGITVIDAGHFATEQLMTQELSALLNQAAADRGWEVSFAAFVGEREPFRTV